MKIPVSEIASAFERPQNLFDLGMEELVMASGNDPGEVLGHIICRTRQNSLRRLEDLRAVRRPLNHDQLQVAWGGKG